MYVGPLEPEDRKEFILRILRETFGEYVNCADQAFLNECISKSDGYTGADFSRLRRKLRVDTERSRRRGLFQNTNPCDMMLQLVEKKKDIENIRNGEVFWGQH